jgi:DNA-binding response OmpR family regulator
VAVVQPLRLRSGVISIVVADDEPHVVDLVRVTLEDARVRVFEAADGGTALYIAEAIGPDLVLLDVHLPDISGLEVCRLLRKHPQLASTSIVMLTAAAQQDDIARGFSAGATDYLTKPFSPLRLLTLVERLLPRRAWPPA